RAPPVSPSPEPDLTSKGGSVMATKKNEEQEQPQQEQPQPEQQDEQKDEQKDEQVSVEMSQDTATLLLAAAEELDLDASVVKVDNGYLSAPARVVEKAGVDKAEQPEPKQGTVAEASDDDAVAANEKK